jgi:hypothetical protein
MRSPALFTSNSRVCFEAMPRCTSRQTDDGDPKDGPKTKRTPRRSTTGSYHTAQRLRPTGAPNVYLNLGRPSRPARDARVPCSCMHHRADGRRRPELAAVSFFVALSLFGDVSSAGDNVAQTDLARDPRSSGRALMTFGDPNDVEPCASVPDCPIDIRQVSKRRFTAASGQRRLVLGVEAYELYGGLVLIANIKLRLDVRSGPRADAHVYMALTELSASIGWACGRRYEGGTVSHGYRLKVRGDRLKCIVPLHDLRPTKRIRLQALSRVNRSVVDRAPNSGWAA